MHQNMTERKAFRHALLTVVTATLLAAVLLCFAVPLHPLNLPVLVVIILVPSLLLVPFVQYRYMEAPHPPLTRKEHVKKAVWCGSIAVAYLVLNFTKHVRDVTSLWSWAYVGLFVLLSLNHLREAYRKRESPAPTQ
jgi:FtsH-binding integral membrane protein